MSGATLHGVREAVHNVRVETIDPDRTGGPANEEVQPLFQCNDERQLGFFKDNISGALLGATEDGPYSCADVKGMVRAPADGPVTVKVLADGRMKWISQEDFNATMGVYIPGLLCFNRKYSH